MVSNATKEFVWQVVDANQEYNTKMVLIFTLFFISLALFLYTYWVERRDERWNEDSSDFWISRVILKRAFRWCGGAYMFIFLPMFLFAYRGAKLETLLNIVYTLYIPLFACLFIFGVMYAWDTVYFFTGLNKRRTRTRRGRR